MTNMDVTADSVEEKLSSMLDGINFDMFTKEDIIDFYENISLRKNVWISFFKCQKLRNELDFQTLKATRF